MNTDIAIYVHHRSILIITVYTDNTSLKKNNHSKNHLRMKEWHSAACITNLLSCGLE